MIVLSQQANHLSLPIHVSVCDSFFLRLRGALAERRISRNRGFWFPGCRSIHTFGMKEPIDLLFPGSDGQILSYERAVPPLSWFCGPRSAMGVLELSPERIAPRWTGEDYRLTIPGMFPEPGSIQYPWMQPSV